jgi:peptidoglycan/xylan/chitin deacetylase (PgdA/CDA1 family)
MFPPLRTRVARRIARHLRTKPFVMRNTAPLVSFTFDDVPDSAYTNGAAVLDDYGIRGTFYIAGGTCGTSDTYWRVIEHGQVRDLHARGHEIGCHTFSHAPVDELDAQAMEAEWRRNFETMRALCADIEITNFCYPFGVVSLRRKLQLQKHFDTCRGIFEGVNAGTIDLSLLKVIELYDRTLSRDKLRHVLRSARDRNGWVVFYAHDVTQQPSLMGCSPALLRTVIDTVRSQNIACLSIRQALPAIGYSSKRELGTDIGSSGSNVLLSR